MAESLARWCERVTTEEVDRITRLQVEAVERFMNLNYPCTCTDNECPGNYYEASEIVRMVRELEDTAEHVGEDV